MEKVNRRAGELVIQAIKKQIRQNDPPETKETFDRLRREGHAEEEVYRMLGCVMTSEIYEVMKDERVFDRDLYVQRLRALPKLPWE
jgi:hypothetical protein